MQSTSEVQWVEAQMPDLSTWISGVSTFIALVAFFRSDIARWYRKRKSEIRFYPIGNIEVGYSSFGPTLGVVGSFWPFFYDQFISEISIDVQRNDDNAEISMGWFIFRSAQMTFDLNTQEEQQTQLEGAAPIFLGKNSGKTMNILFINYGKRRNIQNTSASFFDHYRKFYQRPEVFKALEENVGNANNISPIALYKIYTDQFPEETQNAKNDIYREFWWKAGTYNAQFRIHSEYPNKIYDYHFDFEISQREEIRLLQNVETVLMETSGVKPIRYNFAYPEYKNLRLISNTQNS